MDKLLVSDKKVLLRESKGHTVSRVVSTHGAALSSGERVPLLA